MLAGVTPTVTPRHVTRDIKPRDWYPAFLAAYRNSGIIRAAAQAAGVSRETVEGARLFDPSFAADYAAAKRDALELIEAALRQRALTISDTAAIYLMKILGGEEWRQDRAAPAVGVNIDARVLVVGESKL